MEYYFYQKKIEIYKKNEKIHITEILKNYSGKKVAGAFGYWRITGLPVLFRAKKIILATGGSGMAYRINSNSWEYTGDGPAMALRAAKAPTVSPTARAVVAIR